MHAKQFGIDKNEGIVRTFLTNDWIHSIFTNQYCSTISQQLAKYLIMSQIILSAVGLAYFQGDQDQGLTLACLYCLLFGVMSLSNATKNQKDVVSRIVQSYATKSLHTTLLCLLAFGLENSTNAMIIGILAFPFCLDTLIGLVILIKVFKGRDSLQETNLIQSNSNQWKEVSKENFNNRLPEIFKEGKIACKMFSSGWKFNMFNVQGQFDKQISAITVIFMMFYCSLLAIIFRTPHQCFCTIVLTYSIICLFSFFNLTYVRDFDALQINMSPVILAIGSLIALVRYFDATILGVTLALLGDAYCALRFKDNSDKINYTPLEQFVKQSWIQSAFQKQPNLTLQIVATVFIFLQISLSLLGVIFGQVICAWILAFYLIRLVQFFGKNNLGFQMLQSNMTCIALVTVCFFTGQAKLAQGALATIATLVLLGDAILGTALFYAHNKNEILKQFSIIKTILPKSRIEQTINIGMKVSGNIVQLGMGTQKQIESNDFQKV